MSFGEGDLHKQIEKLKAVNAKLCAEVNKVTDERDALEIKLARCEKEREVFRSMCSEMLGKAHDLGQIVTYYERLLDEGLA